LGERRRVGRFDRWASSPGFSFGRPCDLPGLSFELVSVCVVVPLVLPHDNRVEVRVLGLPRWVGRAVGLDVHRDFCAVAICEDGVTRSAGRVASTPDGLRALAESLLVSDRVALEVTGSCWEVARLLEPACQPGSCGQSG
jgi:hypothetical protein